MRASSACSWAYETTDTDEAVLSPTEETSRDFYTAFVHFNEAMFDGQLRDCLITMQRQSNTRGYFANGRFGHRQSASILDEIALNPATFKGRTDREIISTLVHEMAQLWQQQFGKPGRGRYHNRQWADKMEALGLMPSSTGQPGGKRTGQRQPLHHRRRSVRHLVEAARRRGLCSQLARPCHGAASQQEQGEIPLRPLRNSGVG
jgi:predicted SprT family Zn-dependent metalloprotease